MPPKRIQKSRQRGINDMDCFKSINPSTKSNSTTKTSKKSSLKMNEKSSSQPDFEYETLDDEDEIKEEPSNDHVDKAVSRTTIYILDYLQFKAARIIQRFVRGWLARLAYTRKRWAAVIIQTEWRRFYAGRLYFRKLENVLQQRLEEHYFRSAQKIQALWRGCWVREHVHDQTRLLRLQLMAGEDLLHCIAFKLHHLLRTHQIPGIYSLRNSSALSKVETLLASMTFKTCTERVRKAHDFRRNQLHHAKKQFEKSAHGIRMPFPGPNIHNACTPKCMPIYSEKEADRKMNRILRMYEEANRQNPHIRSRQQKTKLSQQLCGFRKVKAPTTFCGDVVHSMRKWRIIAENNVEVDPNVFQRPENLEHFLTDIKSWWSLLHGNCYCRPEYVKEMSMRETATSGRKP